MINDLFQAEVLRDKGIKKATDSAERAYLISWNERAYKLLMEFVIRNRFKHVLGEDIRITAELAGLPKPPSKRAWGGVIRRAAKNNVIRKVGYGRTTNPTAHRTPATLWEVL